MFFLQLLIFVLVGLSVAQEENGGDSDRYACGPCDKSACPTDLDCRGTGLELVPDRCSCCMVCPKLLGERCGGPGNADGRCASDYMICAGKSVYEPVKDGQVGQCVCKTFDRVCGTDGVVYNNNCELMVESFEQVRKGQPAIRVDETDELCLTVPTILVPPKDSSLQVDSQSELSCEAIGRPVPDIIWTKDGEELPGNHINIATRKRNGPAKFGMTSWVLIQVSPEDDGSYTCTARNSQGEASATANVQVTKRDTTADNKDDNMVPIEL